MGCRALLALSFLYAWAQGKYRPFAVGYSGYFPYGPWGQRRLPFPQNGYTRLGHGLYGAKYYYDRTRTRAWFVFLEVGQWGVHTSGLIQSLIPPGETLSPESRPPYRMLYSTAGGGGLIWRVRFSPHFWLAVGADLRIAHVSYPTWLIPLQNNRQLEISIESNSFIGGSLMIEGWMPLYPNKNTYALGAGIDFPQVWGAPSYYTLRLRDPNGDRENIRNKYYIRPLFGVGRLMFSFTL